MGEGGGREREKIEKIVGSLYGVNGMVDSCHLINNT